MAIRIMYKISRFWRFYFLLVIASILMTYLIYIGRNDPYLQNSFPYFRLDQKFNSIFSTSNTETIKRFMEKNVLDYEFIYSNSKFCFDSKQQINDIAEDYLILNQKENNEEPNKSNFDNSINNENNKFDLILIAVSKAGNFRHRIAIRQTWAKYLSKINARIAFVVGNPFLTSQNSNKNKIREKRLVKEDLNTDQNYVFTQLDKLKFEREIKDYQDIVQINVPDNDNFTTTKTLISFRWLQTYCQQVKYVFVLSDSAVLNHFLFEEMILKKNLLNQFVKDDNLVGMCDGKDENFARVLRLFFNDIYKSNNNNNRIVKKDISNIIDRNIINATINNLTFKNFNEDKNSNNKKIMKYNGEYCRNLGWIVTYNGARKIWQAALRTQYMMRISPHYLNGYLAIKANLKHTDLFKYYDIFPPMKTNCLHIFQNNPTTLLCAENFTNSNRYSSYISAWNSPAQSQMQLSKL